MGRDRKSAPLQQPAANGNRELTRPRINFLVRSLSINRDYVERRATIRYICMYYGISVSATLVCCTCIKKKTVTGVAKNAFHVRRHIPRFGSLVGGKSQSPCRAEQNIFCSKRRRRTFARGKILSSSPSSRSTKGSSELSVRSESKYLDRTSPGRARKNIIPLQTCAYLFYDLPSLIRAELHCSIILICSAC